MKKFNFATVDIVIYHARCMDGFACAMIINKIATSNPEYKPFTYGSTPPNVTGKNVLICDFSFPANITNAMILKAKSLLIIDHHETSAVNLIGIDSSHKIFDTNHCGCYLTWKACYPDIPVPLFIKLIEDHDLWTFKLPGSREFSSMLQITPFTFENYSNFLAGELPINKYIDKGKIILQAINYDIENMPTEFKVCQIGGFYYGIAYAISSQHQSEIGNYLTKKYPNCDFAAVIYYSNGNSRFSLRSDDKKMDVRIISEMFGGGGHRNASGFTLAGIHSHIGEPVFNMDITGVISNTHETKFCGYNVINIQLSHNKKIIGTYIMQRHPNINIVAISNYIFSKQKTEFVLICNKVDMTEIVNKLMSMRNVSDITKTKGITFLADGNPMILKD